MLPQKGDTGWAKIRKNSVTYDFAAKYSPKISSNKKEPLSLHPNFKADVADKHQERCSSGLRGTPGKRVYAKSVSGVRIPLSPLS